MSNSPNACTTPCPSAAATSPAITTSALGVACAHRASPPVRAALGGDVIAIISTLADAALGTVLRGLRAAPLARGPAPRHPSIRLVFRSPGAALSPGVLVDLETPSA